MSRSSCHPTKPRTGNGSPLVPEHDLVRLIRDVQAERYGIPKDTTGTVVGIYGEAEAYAVEITNLSGGPEVVTLQADQVERARCLRAT